ncbi:MAG TPA: response regulator, partial [Dissulfurispiraceae bacterium]|nr:response regulator [Dissulfurispiraceae bacterium]
SSEHLTKIFDPYFTTKTRGSGLGLATVFSILKKHGGHITVESEDGAGTTFTIYLPATREDAYPDNSEKDTLTKGYGNILVMDDEELVRETAGGMLTMLGFQVQFTEDGEKAVALYKKALQEKNPFRVLIMDLTIPGGMGGKEAVAKILEMDPEAKAIASSGYSTDPVMSEFKKYGFAGVITKPYRIHQMSEAIYKVLSL